MKVYKVELMIVDHNDLGENQIQDLLEDIRYLSHPVVTKITGVEIGEWESDNLLNDENTWEAEFERLFKVPNASSDYADHCNEEL